jgi:hypothetical protein
MAFAGDGQSKWHTVLTSLLSRGAISGREALRRYEKPVASRSAPLKRVRPMGGRYERASITPGRRQHSQGFGVGMSDIELASHAGTVACLRASLYHPDAFSLGGGNDTAL